MSTIFSQYKYLILSALLVSSFGIGQSVVAQHEGHNMPGMSKAKPKPKAKQKKATLRKRKPVARRKTSAKKHDMSNMPAGTHMPGMNMPHEQPKPSPKASLQPMPQTAPHQTHTPGMQLPATPPTPSASSD